MKPQPDTTCEACNTPILSSENAIILSPPQRKGVGKHHICRKCYYVIYDIFTDLPNIQRKLELADKYAK